MKICIFIVGIVMIIYSVIKLIKSRGYDKVISECLSTETSWLYTDGMGQGYKSKFKYNYHDKEYVFEEENYFGKKKAGDKYNLWVNPLKDNKIISGSDIVSCFVLIVFGLCLSLVIII